MGDIQEMSGTESEMYGKACFLSRLVASSVKVSQSAGTLMKVDQSHI